MSPDVPSTDLRRRHLVFGWWSLLVFLALGLALEALHGFKLRWYLDVGNETRRLMLTLAHAHGTLLALVHLAFAATLEPRPPSGSAFVSRALLGASVLLPGGFALGGLFVYDGDPGLGVLLVPAGALLLLAAVLRRAWSASRRADGARSGAP